MERLWSYLTPKRRRSHPYNIPWRGARPIPFPVYNIPVNLLFFNFNNTRIKAELQGELYKRRQVPDPGNEKHVDLVSNILLKSKWIGVETAKLTDDLQKRGQLDPVVATPDGTLIDGNRRLAIFRHLKNNEPDSDGFGELETCILPAESTTDDLKEFEMRMQMYHQFQVPYGDINTSLEFRCLHKELGWGLSRIEEITGSQYRAARIQKMIDIIDMVDEYLELVPPKGSCTKQYSSLSKGWESFATLYRMIQWTRRTNPSDRNLMRNRKYFGFAIIHSENTTYNSMRNFYSILRLDEANKQLVANSDTLQGRRLESFMDSARVESDLRKMEHAFEFLKALKADPHVVVKQAYKKLDTIKASRIIKNDMELIRLLDEMLKKIQLLRDRL